MDIFLGIIIVALIGFNAFQTYSAKEERQTLLDAHQAERNKYINALVAKSDAGMRDLDLGDKVVPIKVPPADNKSPDMIPLDQISDEDFDAHIQESLLNNPTG